MRILYVMHVDWRWIWQRPHVLATGLDQAGMSVVVRYSRSARTSSLRDDAGEAISRRALPTIPGSGRWKFSRVTTAQLRRRALYKDYREWRPDVVWVTYPTLWDDLPDQLRRLPVIYDAMDVAAPIYRNPSERGRIAKLEKELCSSASLVLASSSHLVSHLRDTTGVEANLVRNGHELKMMPEPRCRPKENIRALYVGTISEWFDFKTVLDLLRVRESLTVDLAGPASVPIPRHSRLRHLGVVAHQYLSELARGYDMLLMPFVVNDVILGVDPVKLYEYTAWRIPIAAVDYPEIRRFGTMINTYADVEELVDIFDRVRTGDSEVLPRRIEAEQFLQENLWGDRIGYICDLLRRLDHRST